MSRYLSPAQYRYADDGLVPVDPSAPSDITDRALAHIISRAEADVDAYMEFDLKHGGFEPHFTSIQRLWDERSLRTGTPNNPVPVRQVTRYRIQVSNITTSGAGFFATINAGDAVVNTDSQYIEIVPLQAVLYSLSPVILQLGLRPPIVQMDVEVGFYLPFFGETLYNDSANKTYYAIRGFWASTYTQSLASQPNVLPPVPPVVYKNGSVVDPSLYMVNYTEGAVTFTTPNQGTDSITGDYTATIPDPVRGATVDQVTYLLGQRALNKLGMQGLEFARSELQQVKRHLNADATAETGALCYSAAQKLNDYKPIPIA